MCVDDSHRVQFYDSDAFLARSVLDFVETARKAGDGVIVILTREHRAELQALMQAGPQTVRWDGEDDCVFLDVRESLAGFMDGAMPDETRFAEVSGALLNWISRGGTRHVSAYGEMAAVLYADGKPEAAARVEQLWDSLKPQYCFSMVCSYPMSVFSETGHCKAFQRICAAHTHVNPMESLGGISEPDALHRTVALLQQRTAALESELRRRQASERELASQAESIAKLTAATAQLEHMASHDALTGLANRRIFVDRLTHGMERATRTGHPLALIFIDLDGFKAINDRCGHLAGDHLLQQIAARLTNCARAVDTVCRWGGDEFTIITEDTDSAQARALMHRIALALDEPYVLGDTVIRVSASIGLSQFPEDAEDAQTLLDNADMAMYRAKRNRRARATTVTVTEVRAHA